MVNCGNTSVYSKKGGVQDDNGLCISTWLCCQESNPFQVMACHAKLVSDAYNIGFGNRKRCVNKGQTVFLGKRITTKGGKASPINGPKENQEYTRNYYDPRYQPHCEKLGNILADSARTLTSYIEPCMYKIMPGHKDQTILRGCGLKIITQGHPNSTMGFCNETHVDAMDRFNNEMQQSFKMEIDVPSDTLETWLATEKKRYISKWIESFGIGIQTTCVYQFISSKINSFKILQYFVYEGLQLAVEVPNYSTHIFYPHAFSHCTAFPLAINEFGKVISRHGDGLNIFAWGVGQKMKK